MELHFGISELLGVMIRTHGEEFLSVFGDQWHDTISTMSHEHCLKEDRQFSFCVMNDVIEYGLQTASVAEPYLVQVMPILLSTTESNAHAAVRQTCVKTLGIAVARFPQICIPFASNILRALARCIAVGEEPGNLILIFFVCFLSEFCCEIYVF